MYTGVAPVMKTPADKVIIYLVVSAIVLFVAYLVIGLVVASVATPFALMPHTTS